VTACLLARQLPAFNTTAGEKINAGMAKADPAGRSGGYAKLAA
jgi:hypothetical protein